MRGSHVLSVRGLTTAASIWMTAVIGILAGVGFYVPVVLTTVLTLGTLSFFRWIEARMPTQIYARHRLRCARDRVLPEAELRARIGEIGFSIANLSYELSRDGRFFEYRMMLRMRRVENLRRLANALAVNDAVLEFRIALTGD